MARTLREKLDMLDADRRARIEADAEAFRWQTMDPVSSQDTAQADRPPRDNGVYEPAWDAGSENIDYIGPGVQVWVKRA